MSTLDYQRRKRFINAIVSDTNLSYRESDDVRNVPNNQTIVMPTYKPDFTDEQDQAFMSQLLNKCYHAMPDNIADSRQALDPEKPFTTAHNIVCRSNAQLKRQGMLPGADSYLTKDSDRDAMQFVKALNDGAKIAPELEAVKAFDIISRGEWQTGNDFAVSDHISEEGRTMLNKMLSDDTLLHDYQQHRAGGVDNVDMTRRLLEEATDEEQAEQMQEEAQAGGEPEEGGEGDGEGKSGEQGEAGKGKGEKGEGDDETEGQSSKAEYDPLHEHVDGFDVNKIGTNQNITYSDREFTGQFKAAKSRIVEPRGTGEGDGGRKRDVRDMIVGTLSKKVRNILKVYSQARYAGGKKKGKINKRAIASITTGNERIFRLKQQKDVLDTSVMLLVDTSGSMCGSRYSHAVAATAMLNDCLSKLNIPHAVYGFTYCSGENLMYEHKKFGQPASQDDIINNMCSDNIRMSGNDDGDAVLFAHDKLIQTKQKRKILIVLSDGQPTDPPGCNADHYLQTINKEIDTKSPVELYGLGIETRCVSKYYSKYEVIDNCSHLEEKLLNIIKNSIVA